MSATGAIYAVDLADTVVSEGLPSEAAALESHSHASVISP